MGAVFRGGPGRAVVAVSVAVVAVVAGAVTARAGEHLHARGIDAACTPGVQEPALAPFSDVAGNVHEPAINCLAHWNVAHGVRAGPDGVYAPGGLVTRGQMASFLARMVDHTDHNLPEPDDRPAFADTAGGVHRDNIARLAEADIVDGRPDGTYSPEEPVSRAAMATLLARTVETVTGKALDADDAGEPAFPDTAGGVHEANVDALAAHGIVQGHPDGTYGPREPVRRDGMASFVARSMDKLAEQAHWPVPSDLTLDPNDDTTPANLVHRVEAVVTDQWGEGTAHELTGADVRFEVYRAGGNGYELVYTGHERSGLHGDLVFAYNAGAAAEDEDVVVACLPRDADPADDERFCALETAAEEPTLVADDAHQAQAVANTWTGPVEVRPAGDGWHTGNVLAHDPTAATVDLQTGVTPDDEAELLRLAYAAPDTLVVTPAAHGLHDATVEQFACALQTALQSDEEAYPRLEVGYHAEDASLFELSTDADLSPCVAAEELAGSWVLVGGHGPNGPLPLVEDAPITLHVEDGPWGWRGTAACNGYRATVHRHDDELTVDELIATQVACPRENVMASEKAYLRAFPRIDSFDVDDSELVLTGDDVRLHYDKAQGVDDG